MIDHKLRVSYFGQQVGIDLSDKRYLVLSKRTIIPAYTTMEKRDGPRRPERKMLHPSKEVIQLYLTDRSSVWQAEISYETHNLIRKRPGGRDETWPEDKFLAEIQSAIQYPFKNRFLIFKVKGGVDENDYTISLDVRQKKGDVVTNYMKVCELSLLNPEGASDILAQATSLENTMVSFYCKRGNLKRLKMYLDNGGDLNNVSDGAWSPLQLAVYGGHMDIVQYLLTEMHADPNVRSADNMDPLFCAIKGGHLDIFEALEQAGAKLRRETEMAEGEEGHLTYATACHQVEIVRYINRPDGPLVADCNAEHGVRNRAPPERFFTTIDGGYPFSHVPPPEKKRGKSRGKKGRPPSKK